VLDEGEWLALHPGCFTLAERIPDTHWGEIIFLRKCLGATGKTGNQPACPHNVKTNYTWEMHT